jgi:hypothetical protein
VVVVNFMVRTAPRAVDQRRVRRLSVLDAFPQLAGVLAGVLGRRSPTGQDLLPPTMQPSPASAHGATRSGQFCQYG